MLSRKVAHGLQVYVYSPITGYVIPFIKKALIPAASVFGFIMGLQIVAAGNKPIVPAQPVAAPAQAPYTAKLAGAGIVEASSENIKVGTNVGGIVTELFVTQGQQVKIGDALFRIDDRTQHALVASQEAAVLASRERLERLSSFPRPEDIPVREAQVAQSVATLADAKAQLELTENAIAKDPRSISRDIVITRRTAVDTAAARVDQAKAELALLKAGTYAPEIAVAKAELAQQEALLLQQKTELERHTVKALIDAEVLQINIRPGEFAQTGVSADGLILLGRTDVLNIRVDIDENDAWRFREKAQATAYVRGNNKLNSAITFARVEPFIVPKRSLTGDSNERVDTRVMQVLYSFPRTALPVLVGQQVDVFIEDLSTTTVNP